MRVLALDIGLKFGFAIGEAGSTDVRSGSIIVGKQGGDPHEAASKFGIELRRQFFALKSERPDLVVAEAPLHPSASFGGNAIVAQFLMHGALDDNKGAYGFTIRRAAISSVRKHFLGAASVTPRTKGRERTPKEREAARKAIKAAVLARAHMLGYLPRSVDDTDRSDAIAIWDYSVATFARVTPAAFALTAEARQ